MPGLWPAIRANKQGRDYRPAGAIFAVDGTVYPGAPGPPVPILDNGTGWWSGFSSGIVGGLSNIADGLWATFCIGYPAATVPMWPSVQIGRGNLKLSIKNYANWHVRTYGSLKGLAILLTGYSQGSMVVDQVWVSDILAQDGELHELLPYVYRSYQFGHIFRTPGICHGNELANLPMPAKLNGEVTGGIGGALDLTAAQTNYIAPDGQPVVMSCNNDGDIYGGCPVGLDPWKHLASPGKTGNRFFKIIMQPTAADIAETGLVALNLWGSIQEMVNALKFAAEGTNAPHWLYFPAMDACITDALNLGMSLPHSL